MLNIIAPEAHAVIGGRRSLQRLAVMPAAMRMAMRAMTAWARGCRSLARANIQHDAALPTSTDADTWLAAHAHANVRFSTIRPVPARAAAAQQGAR
ncbi:hypothetical protein ACU10_02255 [Xanthomonas oryzae pv. oryzicola]|uniref:Uncharacterized protein n=1 Tax=Xanthomonas oryzae pv. oryzicola (strain BLS256) TaxID=383407 RepID=G7TKC0_XANOB|nr:hypothetical protein XOC_4181 [Xanthomonas oryzae pv. oryzicola BLS256]AJQ86164.1 hypothetical protein BE73_02795 [Xanthomonas oryzae pv. oryzicola]AKN92056.1 hypothetical protein ACU13_02255 [Xanthomonas oryzae pv. oryzicola]AKN95796.1 hypothetical protein ACU10_02255 [Xanthomonas oryzae pv. oryzicola]AKO05932.1 hypothetical protein ACU16_19335 [Xanthomonas oryzae pv. oryzicola]